MLIQIARGPLDTLYGSWDHRLFYDGQRQAIAMIYGRVPGPGGTLARVHSSCVTGNVFLSTECECLEQLEGAMREIRDFGAGLIVWLDQEGRANGMAAHVLSQNLKKGPEQLTQWAAYERLGFPADARTYTTAGEIFQFLDIRAVRLMTDNEQKIAQLRAFGLTVEPFSMRQLLRHPVANGDAGGPRREAHPTFEVSSVGLALAAEPEPMRAA